MDQPVELKLQQAIVPVMMFGPLPLCFLLDLPAGGRCSVPPDDKPGTLAIILPPIPPGSIVCFLPPEPSTWCRPEVQRQKELKAEFCALEANGVQVFIYADLIGTGQPLFTEGMGPLGKLLRTHAVPDGSMLVVLPPELADKVRPSMREAVARARQAELAGQNGQGGIHVRE